MTLDILWECQIGGAIIEKITYIEINMYSINYYSILL